MNPDSQLIILEQFKGKKRKNVCPEAITKKEMEMLLNSHGLYNIKSEKIINNPGSEFELLIYQLNE